MIHLRTSILLLATTLIVVPARATTSFYAGAASETQFNTDTAAMTLLNPTLVFASTDLASGGLFNASGTGIDFLGFDGGFPGFGPLDFTVNSGKLTATNAGEVIQISLPAAGVYAFGFHFTLTSGFGSWCVELTHGTCDYQLNNTTPANVQFFGMVSTAPITAPIYFRNQGGNPTAVLPNFEAFGTGSSSTSSTPEPTSIMLAGLGLITLGLLGQRTRRKMQRPL
jgi:hypothetical protein